MPHQPQKKSARIERIREEVPQVRNDASWDNKMRPTLLQKFAKSLMVAMILMIMLPNLDN